MGEFLSLLDALRQHVIMFSMDEFYVLARTALVKDETQYDRYDAPSPPISRAWTRLSPPSTS